MNFNFDTPVSRRDTNSYKWDSAPADVLPMWVADMDFPTAPAIVRALQRRVAHGIFGYTRVPDAYYRAVSAWFGSRHGWPISTDHMLYTSGVVPALSATIKALTRPGDRVMVQTPVYNCFFSSIRNNGCEVAPCPLRRQGLTYEMDFDSLEHEAANPRTTLMLLCNPHNPVGRVWTRQELRRVGEICGRHGVTVVADEIHCELVFEGHTYTPFAACNPELAAHTVSCLSPSKAFNMAGLQIATIVAADPDVRRRIDKAININEVCDVNPFGVEATLAAYGEGEEWLDALLRYLHDNYLYLRRYCTERLPDFPVMNLEGTYLVWMDCSVLGLTAETLEQRLLSEAQLWLNAGTMYGAEGEGYLRWNIACPRSVLHEGLERFSAFVRELRAQG